MTDLSPGICSINNNNNKSKAIQIGSLKVRHLPHTFGKVKGLRLESHLMETPVIQNLTSNWRLNRKGKTHRGNVKIRDLILSLSD